MEPGTKSNNLQPKETDLKPYKDLEDMAVITEDDIKEAEKEWERLAPDEFKGLLKAEIEQ